MFAITSRRIRTAAASLLGVLLLALTACGTATQNDQYAIYTTGEAAGYTNLGKVNRVKVESRDQTFEKVSAYVGQCPVILAQLNNSGAKTYSVVFNGLFGAEMSDKVLTPKNGVGALPPATEIARVLNFGAIAKERGVTTPGKVPAGVCDPYAQAPKPTATH